MTIKIIAAVFLVIASALLAAFLFTQWKSLQIAARFPPSGEFADVDGGRIHYRQMQPSGEAAGTIVLIHGASGNESDMRLPLGDKLVAQGFRVISVDRPGHGWSTRDDRPSDPDRQARQIRQALDKIGVKRAVIAGHSLAGAMTLQLALDHSDVVEGVVLIAAVTHPWPGGIASYYKITASPVFGPLFANTIVLPFALTVMDASLKTVFEPQDTPPEYRERTAVELVLRPHTFRANAIDVAAMYDFVVREQERYKQIAIPVDIITGDSDTIVLTHIHSYGSARDIPGATMHVMKDVGHSPHWANSEEVAQRIASFAKKVRGGTVAGR